MTIKIITAPAAEPVLIDDLKLQLRIDGATEDPILEVYLKAATETIQLHSGRALITQTLELILDEWPAGDTIELPSPPLQTVTSIKYKDAAGDESTLSSANYVVDTDSQPGRIRLTSAGSWPGGTLYPASAIRVRFTAGYGDAPAAVPYNLRMAVLLLAGHYYEHREATQDGRPAAPIPFGVQSLIWLDRLKRF